jgi:hypothetical protein
MLLAMEIQGAEPRSTAMTKMIGLQAILKNTDRAMVIRDAESRNKVTITIIVPRAILKDADQAMEVEGKGPIVMRDTRGAFRGMGMGVRSMAPVMEMRLVKIHQTKGATGAIGVVDPGMKRKRPLVLSG